MNFQGRLNDSTGAPMPNGVYNMTFRIYSVATGGTALWTETHAVSAGQGVTITTGGLFSTQLGSITSLPPSIFNTSTPLYLEVELPSPATATSTSPSWTEGPMTPRNPIESSPYAINADYLGGQSASSFAAASGSANYIQNQTANPQSASFNISGTGTATELQTASIDTASAGVLTIGGTNATAIALAKSTTISGSLVTTIGSTAAFQIQNAAGASVLNADTTTNTITLANLTVSGNVATVAGADYATTGTDNNVNFGTGSLFRLTGTGLQTITGIAGGTNGRQITLVNAGVVAAVLNNDDTTDSSAANVIITGSGSNLSLPVGASISLVYDGTSAVWRVIGGIGGSGSSSGNYVTLQSSTTGTADNGDINISGTAAASAVQVTGTSTTAFTVQNAAGSSLLTADTTDMTLKVVGGQTIQAAGSSTAPVVIGGTSNVNPGGTTDTVTIDSNTKVGDLVIYTAYVEPNGENTASANYGTITTPAGLTLAPGFPINTDDATMATSPYPDTHRLYVWYSYATANGSQSMTFSDNLSVWWGIDATTVRGGPTGGDPFADTPATATSSSSATGVTTTPPVSLTLGGTNSLVLWMDGDWSGNSNVPGGYTTVVNGANNGQPMVASANYAAGGSTGTITASADGNDNGITAALLSIRSDQSPLTIADANGNQTFQVNGVGGVAITPSSDIANALTVQSAAGSPVLNVNTANGQVSIGNGNAPTGQLYVPGNFNQTPVKSVSLTDTTGHQEIGITSGNYTYLADNGTGEVDIYDTSNPQHIAPVGTWMPANSNVSVSDMVVAGHYLYLAAGSGAGTHIDIINISNPARPIYVTMIDAGGNTVAVRGNQLYTTAGNALYIYDVTNPTTPTLLTDTTIPSAGSYAVSANGLALQGDYAYIAGGGDGLLVYDIAGATPQLVGRALGTWGGGVQLYTLTVQGHYVYALNGNDGEDIQVFDVRNPSAPVQAGDIGAPINTNAPALQAAHMIASGQYLYFGSGTGPFVVYDISSPASINQVAASTNTSMSLAGIRGRYAFMVNYNTSTPTLQAYDLGGTYTQQLQAGDTETGSLQVDANANVAGTLNVQGGVTASSLMAGSIGGQSLTLSQAPEMSATSIFGDAGLNVSGTFNHGVNYLATSQYTTGASAVTVSYLNAYVANVNIYPYNQYQMGIYTDNSGTPGSLVVSSSVGTLNPSDGWNSIPIPATTLSANTTYWIGLVSNTPDNGYNQMGYDSDQTCNIVDAYANATFGTLPSTIAGTYGSNNNVFCDSFFASTASSNGPSTIFQIQNTGGTNLMAANVQLGTVGFGQLSPPNDNSFDVDSSPEVPTLTTGGTAGTTTYSYVTTAVDGNGVVSNASPVATITTGNATLSATNYINVAVQASAGHNSVSCYNVYRVAAGGTSPTSAQTGLIGQCVAAGTFKDEGATVDPVISSTIPSSAGNLTASTTYYYEITATDGAGGESVPTENNATTGATGRAITLSWQAVPGAAGYNIYRGLASGNEQLLTSVGPSATSYIDDGSGTTIDQYAPTVGTAYATQLGNVPNARLVLGDPATGNYLVLSATGGITAYGTAQHVKTILLAPEYAGAVLDATSDPTCSTANSGTMTSGYDSTNRMNYYDWTSTATTAQCYDVVAQVPIPTDFGGWSGTPNIQIADDGNGTAAYALQITPSSGADANYGSFVSPGALGTSWSNATTLPLSGTYTPGDYLTIQIRLSSMNGANVKLGNIQLNYYSKF